MTTPNNNPLLEKFRCNLPASPSAINDLKKNNQRRIPSGYSQFLEIANGGEGFIGNVYLILWRAEELLEMNVAYETDEYAPGLFLFGSNGGGEAFAFDGRSDVVSIGSVPFVGMNLSLFRPLAVDFQEFLQKLATSCD